MERRRRRSLLSHQVPVHGLTGAAGTASVDKEWCMSEVPGIAVVGAGYWGPNLIRNAAEVPEAELVMICDKD